ncbi:lectin-like domain-containing protein [Winogradskyella sp.]|uniref:lectin-like domain-containing protein n=1 Tax=Winogradskyella sp. TaxID=1883156 RepID=UPI003BA94DCE
MNKTTLILAFFCMVCSNLIEGQTVENGFAINNDASYLGSDTFELTPNQMTKNGQIWFTQPLDLTEDFDIELEFNFGSNNSSGADGMTFTLQGDCLSAGGGGGGLGASGIDNSLIVEFDTYRNTTLSDPSGGQDHMAMFRDGVINHSSANILSNDAGSDTVILGGNVEDGNYKPVRFTWVASTQTFEAYLSGSLRLRYIGDLTAIVGQYPYWGVTASTGAATNRHRVRIVTLPVNQVSLEDTTICQGESIITGLPGISNPVWSPDNGVSDINSVMPTFSPTATTTYTLNYQDQCNGITLNQSFTLTVDPKPTTSEISGFDIIDCNFNFNETYNVENTAGSTYQWEVPFGASIVSGQGTNEIEVDFNGNLGEITVVETNSSSCSGDPVSITVDCLLGVNSLNLDDLRIFPNPSNTGSISLLTNLELTHIQIVNLKGQVIRTEDVHNRSGDAYIIENILPGLYVLKIFSEKSITIKRVLVH